MSSSQETLHALGNSPEALKVGELETALTGYAFNKLEAPEPGTKIKESFRLFPFGARRQTVEWKENEGFFTAKFDRERGHCCCRSFSRRDFLGSKKEEAIIIQMNKRGRIEKISLKGPVLRSFYPPILPNADFCHISLERQSGEGLAYSTEMEYPVGTWGMPYGGFRKITLPPDDFGLVLETIAARLLPPEVREQALMPS